MKKLNMFMLGVLGLAFCSCEESIEPAPPQHNEQQPIVKIDDIVSQKVGVLATDAVLTLENYRAEGTMLPVMELVSTENLPVNSIVEYKLELSSSETFDKIVTLNTVSATPNENGSTVYSVSADEWNGAHISLFGKSPKEKTMYYRVPMYLDVDGSDYRVAPTDVVDPMSYYVASGSIEETCMDSGFVIEDAYYFLGSATTWELADVTAEDAFYHNPEVSPYDDPVFTYTFRVSQEVLDANGGGCYWKIAPQSAVDSKDWATVLGCEYDGDTETEGMLTTDNPGAGKITEAGKYEITVNMETMLYSVKHLASVLYIIGAPSGWDINNGALYLSEEVVGSDIYKGVLNIPAGQFQFRLYSQLGNWDKNSIGAQNDDNTVEISFTEGVFEGDVFQGGVNCTQGKGSWQIPGWEGGAVEITVDLNTEKITMKEASVNSGIYLRGGMNGWGADPAYEFILTDKVSTWEVADLTIDAGTEFKVADADWGTVNLGAGSTGTIVPGVPFPLDGGDNIKLGENFKGNVVLTVSGGEYTLTLESK